MKDAKDVVQLFTNAEKKYMRSEFSIIEKNQDITKDP
jgi:hypothetical protein